MPISAVCLSLMYGFTIALNFTRNENYWWRKVDASLVGMSKGMSELLNKQVDTQNEIPGFTQALLECTMKIQN